jgi:hypothetical protein
MYNAAQSGRVINTSQHGFITNNAFHMILRFVNIARNMIYTESRCPRQRLSVSHLYWQNATGNTFSGLEKMIR